MSSLSGPLPLKPETNHLQGQRHLRNTLGVSRLFTFPGGKLASSDVSKLSLLQPLSVSLVLFLPFLSSPARVGRGGKETQFCRSSVGGLERKR